MSIEKKLLGTTSGGDAQNVEDVFSTYLYEGNGAVQSIDNGINLGDFGVGTSTDFATNDYLSRSTDLTGNTDSKTFTFSAWVYHPYVTGFTPYFSSETGSNNGQITIHINSAGYFSLLFNRQGTQTPILKIDISGAVPKNTWTHILISIDMANTSNRYLYINDVLQSPSWSSFIDESLNFTNVNHGVLTDRWSTNETGRIAHVFLDYTYRDLSTASNRRLFIDANGGSTPPTTLSALNPIMYLPMTDGYTIGENLGTGGDFTANGSPTIINKGTEYVAGSGEGGMVWIKSRSTAANYLYDTERGGANTLISNSTNAEATSPNPTVFNSDGFTLDHYWAITTNESPQEFASWTFRKAPRFFDVVTYTGNGTAGREIAHNLGCDVGMIMVKCTSDAGTWQVYHRSKGGDFYLKLDTTIYAIDQIQAWNDTDATSSVFTVGALGQNNETGKEYVAYLFAHDPVGENDDGMIACGSYTGTGANQDIDLGWEAQYTLIKKTNASGTDWQVHDMMRGMAVGGNDNGLKANSSGAEWTAGNYISPNASGFTLEGSSTQVNASSATYIYMAIRAPMMKEPEAGTEVFAIDSGSGSTTPTFDSTFPVDWAFHKTGPDRAYGPPRLYPFDPDGAAFHRQIGSLAI